MGKLDGKVAVITGGASGIGAATVRLFANEGAKVIICDIQEDRGQAIASELGESAVFQLTDVSKERDVRSAVGLAVQKFGQLDCLFNNAGFGGIGGPIEKTPVRKFDRSIGVLLRGVFLGIKHAAKAMKPRGSGSIISTGSVAGLRTGHGTHTYSAAKAAVIHLTRTTAMELGESGIRVNCICPGGIVTPIFTGQLHPSQELIDKTFERLNQNLPKAQPIKRAGQPEDIAQAALWLASDESSFVNGHHLVVDGGLIGGRQWSQPRIASEVGTEKPDSNVQSE